MVGNDRVEVAEAAAVSTTAAANPFADGAEPARLDVADVRGWLVAQVAALVCTSPDEIDVLQPFVHYGIGSAQALELAAKLEDWIGLPLTPTLIWDYPNIESLSRHLAETRAGASATDFLEDQ